MKEQLQRDIETIKRARKILRDVFGKRSYNKDDVEALICDYKCRLKALQPTIHEFKNKDFHIKVWEDEEKIYGETVWIRKGYQYTGRCWNNRGGMIINDARRTRFLDIAMPGFGTIAGISEVNEILKSEIINNSYTLSDIVTELEKADKLSREVVIWDVIEECKGMTDRDKMKVILNKYEYTTDYGETYELVDNTHYLDQPTSFIMCGYQLRLKEGE